MPDFPEPSPHRTDWLFPKCREVTYLTSLASDTSLPWRQRLGWRLHLFLCGHCRTYYRQIRLLQRVLKRFARRLTESGVGPTEAKLSNAARERLRAALRDARNRP